MLAENKMMSCDPACAFDVFACNESVNTGEGLRLGKRRSHNSTGQRAGYSHMPIGLPETSTQNMHISRMILSLSIVFFMMVQSGFGQIPAEWVINPPDYEHTMTVTSVVEINGEPSLNPGDVLAVFYGEECRGVSEPIQVGESYMHFLMIYSNDQGLNLTFKTWDSQVGNIVDLDQIMSFESGGAIGTVGEPFLFTGTNPVSYVDAVDDIVIQFEDDPSPPPINVLENDIFADSPGTSLIILEAPASGQVSGAGDDAFQYIPLENFFGEDSFQYELSNDYSADSAWVYLEITAVNDPPTAFGLMSPADYSYIQEVTETEVEFNWEGANDIEDDPITYTLHVHQAAPWDTSFTISDSNVTVNIEAFPREVWLTWFVTAFDAWDWTASLDTFSVQISQLVDIDSNPVTPVAFSLDQNYPNPFNPSTVIPYDLAEAANVNLQVFDLQGKIIATLQHKVQTAGSYGFMVDLNDPQYERLGSGLYFYRLSAYSINEAVLLFSKSRGMIILK